MERIFKALGRILRLRMTVRKFRSWFDRAHHERKTMTEFSYVPFAPSVARPER
jgi:hypothetical protein